MLTFLDALMISVSKQNFNVHRFESSEGTVDMNLLEGISAPRVDMKLIYLKASQLLAC